MTDVFDLLHREKTALPGLADLPWRIVGNKAEACLEDLGGVYSKPSLDPDNPGWILVIVPPPPAEPFVTELWNQGRGWKRSSRPADGGPAWWLCAYLREGDAEIRVTGLALERSDGVDNWAIPFFAPPPPELSRSKAFKVAYAEWERKCHNDEW